MTVPAGRGEDRSRRSGTSARSLPESGAAPGGRAGGAGADLATADGGLQIFSAVNNTYIGLFYVGTALLFFVLAGILALIMRTQLARPESQLVGHDLYNQLFTMHGTIMMFLFAVPVVEAMAVLLLPNMQAARDLPVSAPLGLCVLGLFLRRAGLLLQPLLRRGAGRRLVHVSAAHQLRSSRPASTPISGCSASASSRSRPSPARSRSSSACSRRARPGRRSTSCRSTPGRCWSSP